MFAAAFGAYAVAVVVATLAWRQVLKTGHRPPAFPHLVAAFWAGESINFLLPAGAPGEVAKGYFLRDRVDTGELARSITIYNLISGLVWVMWILVGSVVVIIAMDVPKQVPGIAAAAACILLVAVTGVRLLMHRGFLGRVLAWGNVLPFVDFDPDAVKEQVRSVDERIRSLWREHRASLGRTVVLILLARLSHLAEVFLLLYGLMPERGAGWLALLSLLVQTASQMVLYATLFVPGQIGTLEGGTAAIFGMVGLATTVGLAMELLRRGRKILAVVLTGVIGLVAKGRKVPDKLRSEPDAS